MTIVGKTTTKGPSGVLKTRLWKAQTSHFMVVFFSQKNSVNKIFHQCEATYSKFLHQALKTDKFNIYKDKDKKKSKIKDNNTQTKTASFNKVSHNVCTDM